MTGLNEGDLDLCDELRADGENASRRESIGSSPISKKSQGSLN
jgi:hypothetical protein